jgi:hypothetical protein
MGVFFLKKYKNLLQIYCNKYIFMYLNIHFLTKHIFIYFKALIIYNLSDMIK